MKTSTLLAGLAIGGAGIATYFALRPARAMGPRPTGPLRPPAPDPELPPPGPLASKLGAFIEGLSDVEVSNLRHVMPSHWWDIFSGASLAAEDEHVYIMFNPMRIDYMTMTPDQQQALQDGLIEAIGYLNAYELQGLLEETQVLS